MIVDARQSKRQKLIPAMVMTVLAFSVATGCGGVSSSPKALSPAGPAATPSAAGPPAGGGSPQAPPSPHFTGTFSNIEAWFPWQTCSSCAGKGGTGPSVTHSMKWSGSPSMDGSSAEFVNAGTFPFADAIWWKQLGGSNGATHFVYEFYFYIQDPEAAQALEFDVNQTSDGKKFVFGTQCGINYDRQWDLWDTANNRWVPTGVECPVQTSSWNHYIAEFHRDNDRVCFDSITLNGVRHSFDKWYSAKSWSGSEINVAFQMDQTAEHRTYSVWLDQVSLKYY